MKLDDIKKLHQKKYRDQFGFFLVEGEHLVLELTKAARHNPALKNAELLVTEQYQAWPTTFKKTTISQKNMALIADTKTPQGIIAVVPHLRQLNTTDTLKERAVYLHEVQDPGNLGTIMRSLAWFGGFRCLLSPNSVDPYNPKAVRASMGAVFHLPMELDVPIDSLRDRYKSIACLDMHGLSTSDPSFKNHDCYLFGNEARGLPKEKLEALSATAFTIPGSGAIDSLNLGSAVNICAYELVRHRP
ncbi:RNA methyltransferase [Proteobacteria bacterium 005FR1]|nr:RNA methyltransferase [Proteobacteria bacterium 005FR1]